MLFKERHYTHYVVILHNKVPPSEYDTHRLCG